MEKAEVLDSKSLECILRECGENISDAVCGFRPALLGINSKMGKQSSAMPIYASVILYKYTIHI